MKIPPEVPSPVRELAVVLSQPKPMRRESVSERTMKCGKASCPCQEDPKARHGHYYSLTRPMAGKTQSRYLSPRSEEHTSELQSQSNLVCRLLLEKKKTSSTYREQMNERRRQYVSLRDPVTQPIPPAPPDASLRASAARFSQLTARHPGRLRYAHP